MPQLALYAFDQTPDCDRESIRAFKLNKPVVPIVVDPFELKISHRPYEIMSDAEILALPPGDLWFVDIEIFVNYLLISFKHNKTGKVVVLEQDDFTSTNPQDVGGLTLDLRKLLYMMMQFLTVGFFSNNFDVPIIQKALRGASTRELKEMANYITSLDVVSKYKINERFGLPDAGWNHIDLFNVVPLKGSLKLYGGRLHCKRMQDLPFEHDAYIDIADRETLKLYNINDLDITGSLYEELIPQIKLRYVMSEQYGVDLRSRSDAQMAEHVIKSELVKLKGYNIRYPSIDVGTRYTYKVPKFIEYSTPLLQNVLATVRNASFFVGESGSIDLPPEIEALDVRIGRCKYRMGIGGLHSSEETIANFADDENLLIDRDVVSYYPRIILNTQLYPWHLGKEFLVVYGRIVERRVQSKKIVDRCKEEIKRLGLSKTEAKKQQPALVAEQDAAQVESDSLKITVNGSFGKLGSKYSSLYAPDRILHVTITGQLCLLMLIEAIEEAGIPVISANTDGVLIKCPKAKEPTLQHVIRWWENRTGFETEEGRYKAVYSRDVNNYITVKEDGTIGKSKGAFAEKGSSGNTALAKNPENLICTDAVAELLTKGIPVEQTISLCRDLRRFCTVRNVTGGATKSGVRLGRCVRWYFSTLCFGQIEYIKSGNKVPNTDGAMPVMELPDEFPTDINYDRYIQIAKDILIAIGHTPGTVKAETKLFFSPNTPETPQTLE